MRVDEGKLRAYLDGELSPPEREQVEQWLAGSPEAQAMLARLDQTRGQVNQTLAALTPAAPSSAMLALKRFQTQLPDFSPDGTSAKVSSSTIWESPSLLAELKTDLKNMRYTWRKTMFKGFIFATVTSLVIVISAIAVTTWPEIGLRIVGELQQAAPTEGVNVPVVEANNPEATTVDAVPELPTGAVPVSAVFNHEIELVGYKLQPDSLTSQGTINLTLYWQSVQAVVNDYTVFIHLTDSTGAIMAQEDSPPARGKFPTSRWSPGQLIEDEHPTLTAENLPTGKYDLRVGLYNGATGERLSVQSKSNPAPDNSFLLAPLTVSAFGYGIQADPNGDTELNIPAIQELGFEWVKFQMPWKIVEPTAGSYDWTPWDQVIDTYAAKNIKVMLNIGKSPDWARPTDDDRSVEGPASDPAQYASFVAKVAQRYQGKIQAIEVWDEQNIWYKAGGKGRINATQYVQLLQQAYPAIKAVNPEMLVISGGLTPAGNVEDMAIDDVEYLNQMYTNGVKGYFDALGAHPAGYNCPALADWRTVTAAEAGATSFLEPFTNRHHSWCFLGTMEAYREVMVANGDSDKAVAITEFGWAVGDSPQPGYLYALDNTPVERAKWLVEAYQWGKQQGWVGPMILWNLDYSLTTPVTELGYFSIYYTSAYEALVKMPK